MEAQIVGVCALISSTLSFQFKTRKQILIAQIITVVFFSIHYVMLGAITGAAMNATSIVRNIVFYNRDKKFFSGNIWVAVFIAVNIIAGILFWQDWNSLLCIIAMVVNTVSMSMKEPQHVRTVMLASSPFFLLYNLQTGSIGGAVNELIAETSGIIALIRYRKKENA